MDTLMMNESIADRTSMSGHNPFNHSASVAHSTNPFDKVDRNQLLAGREGPDRKGNGKLGVGDGTSSIKSQSLFSNYYSGKSLGIFKKDNFTNLTSGYCRQE